VDWGGKNFDHLILNRILSKSDIEPILFKDFTGIRRIQWGGNIFLDALYWLPPCNLSNLAKTWLNEDLKDVFPHDAVKEFMI